MELNNTVSEYHIPVLYRETLDNLITDKNGIYVDCTLGGGGHSEGIISALDDNGRLISIDQDINAINFAKKRLEKFGNRVQIFQDNFQNIDSVLYLAGVDKVDGILMDIGVSSEQLNDPDRGFSYRYDKPLDMRMNQNSELSAYNVVNEYSEEELSRIIFQYGEERFAKRIARAICQKREEKPIETTFELIEVIKKAWKGKHDKHPAKRTFQAIRIEVNKELEVLEKAIDKAIDLLKPKGRLAIITFHSLEDRIVKNKFRDLTIECICPPELPICVCNHKAKGKLINRKPIIPSGEELEFNNRAHSSKLRVIERL